MTYRSKVDLVRENLTAIETLLEIDYLSAGTRGELVKYREELIQQLHELIGPEEAEPDPLIA